jgi:hypothetical protein
MRAWCRPQVVYPSPIVEPVPPGLVDWDFFEQYPPQEVLDRPGLLTLGATWADVWVYMGGELVAWDYFESYATGIYWDVPDDPTGLTKPDENASALNGGENWGHRWRIAPLILFDYNADWFENSEPFYEDGSVHWAGGYGWPKKWEVADLNYTLVWDDFDARDVAALGDPMRGELVGLGQSAGEYLFVGLDNWEAVRGPADSGGGWLSNSVTGRQFGWDLPYHFSLADCALSSAWGSLGGWDED